MLRTLFASTRRSQGDNDDRRALATGGRRQVWVGGVRVIRRSGGGMDIQCAKAYPIPLEGSWFRFAAGDTALV